MNLALRDIVKTKLQKLLDAGFIYPIYDSQCVSPLVIIPKKGGKSGVCVDYRELNSTTRKYHFPLPFIDQVLDSLVGKNYSFLDGFSGYNQIRIALEYQDKTAFTFPWGTYSYFVLPFGICNAPTTSQRAVLSIFSDFAHDSMEIYMDDFTTYDEALKNLEKILKRCQEHNLSLNHEKCFMMMTQGITLGHFVSSEWIQVDPNKIEIISTLPVPQKQRDVRIFLGHSSYNRRFIYDFSKIAAPLFILLTKDIEFEWTIECQHSFEELKTTLTKALVLHGKNIL